MNHQVARERARKRSQQPPTDFRGALGEAIAREKRR
jgi:hypothetical protein